MRRGRGGDFVTQKKVDSRKKKIQEEEEGKRDKREKRYQPQYTYEDCILLLLPAASRLGLFLSLFQHQFWHWGRRRVFQLEREGGKLLVNQVVPWLPTSTQERKKPTINHEHQPQASEMQ